MENYPKKFSVPEYKLCQLTPKHLSLNSNQTNILMGTTMNMSSTNCVDSAAVVKKRPLKTPLKTPLKLTSSSKKTPHNKTNDRYIPNRICSNMEASYHLLVSVKDQENINHFDANNPNDPQQQQQQQQPSTSGAAGVDNVKRKLINDTCQGVLNEKDKVLNLHSKQIDSAEQHYADNMKLFYNQCSSSLTNSLKKTTVRHVCTAPEKILDAPDYRDDFYLNLIDWSKSNNLAVALNQDLYVWNATTKEISQLFAMDESSHDYICSVAWIQRGNVIAVGNSRNEIELWDVNKQTCLRQMRSHTSRVGSLSWNMHLLSSGSRSGDIHHHDVRVANHHVGTLKLHTQEVCGLKWSNDGRYLASGANDNLACIWDSTLSLESNANTGLNQPIFVLREHTAAVKAIAWCPWQNNILATGGGTADGKINIWNIYNGNIVQTQDTKSQISCLLWSKTYKEIVSSHGYQQNQLTLWKYPEMTKVCDLNGHTNRILMMAMSPDEETVASVAADETLRLWKCFPADDRLKKAKDVSHAELKSSQTSLARFIR